MLWRWWKLLPRCHVRDFEWKEMPVLDIHGTSSTFQNTSEFPESVSHYTEFHNLEQLQPLAPLISPLAAVMISPIMQRSEEEPVQKPRWWPSPLVLHHRSLSSVGVLQYWAVWQQAQHTGTPYQSNKTSPNRHFSGNRFIHLQDNRLYQRSSVPSVTYNVLWFFLQDCKVGNGASYQGSTSTTITGVTCQAWSSMTPHQHASFTPETHPDKGLESNVSLCRILDIFEGDD